MYSIMRFIGMLLAGAIAASHALDTWMALASMGLLATGAFLSCFTRVWVRNATYLWVRVPDHDIRNIGEFCMSGSVAQPTWA